MSDTQGPGSQDPGSKPQDGAIPLTTAAKPPEKEPFTPEIIPAPVAKQPSEPKTGEDIEKLRRDYHELREKINTLRENDIVALKEKTGHLNMKFAGAAAIVALISFFGIKLYFFDLNTLIEERIKERTEKAISFNEDFIRASTLAGLNDFQNAIPLFQDLYDQKPDDEILFYKLLDCLNQADRYKDGLPYIDRARKSGFLPGKYRYLFSYNNAGYIVLLESIEESNLRPQAYELLRQAEQIGMKTGDDAIKYPLMNLAIYYTMIGNLEEAGKYGRRYRQYEGENWVWLPWEGALLERLQKVRPTIVDDMKKVLSMNEH
jgi:tetratricopeptide (TPR) repeat protein